MNPAGNSTFQHMAELTVLYHWSLATNAGAEHATMAARDQSRTMKSGPPYLKMCAICAQTRHWLEIQGLLRRRQDSGVDAYLR